jgi:hypothetical protein
VGGGGTPVELASAVASREREGTICAEDADAALREAKRLAAAWHDIIPGDIIPGDMIRRTAERLLRVHALRAADSLQLSAAPIAANHDPATLAMVCFDGRYSRYGDRFELALRLMRNEARTLTIRR